MIFIFIFWFFWFLNFSLREARLPVAENRFGRKRSTRPVAVAGKKNQIFL
jgi:hypothetical protein